MKVPRKWRILLMTVLSLFVVWLIYYASMSVIYGAKLRDLRAQVKAEGSSLDFAELISNLSRSPLSASENAEYLYRAAGNVMEMRTGAEVPEASSYDAFLKTKSTERAKLVSEKRAGLEIWLRDSAVPLELLHQAAKYEHARFDLDYSEGAEMKLPHLKQLHDDANLLMLEAWLAAEQGDAHRALQATWAAFRLRRAIEDEPIGIGQMFGIITDGIAAATLQDIMPVIQPQEKDMLLTLRELQSRKANSFRLVAEGYRASIAMQMESARKNGISYVARNYKYRENTYPGILEAALVRILNGTLLDETFSIIQMNRFVKAASELESMTAAEVNGFDWQLYPEIAPPPHSFGWRFFHESLRRVPLFGSNAREFKRDFARHDVTVCGVAAELYRLEHGNYPTSLDALAPKYLVKLPKDTFSGKALLFKSLPNSVLIYSVGPNGKDDSGAGDQTWDESGPKSDADDIAWRVERTTAATKNP